MSSKDAIENNKPNFKRGKTKNNLKGFDPNDVTPSKGSILIEQVFSSPKNGKFVEIINEKIRKYKTEYPKPLKIIVKNHMQHNKK